MNYAVAITIVAIALAVLSAWFFFELCRAGKRIERLEGERERRHTARISLVHALALVALSSCANSQPIPTTDNPCGLPNFVQVDARVFRSGQPTTEAQWRCVRDVLGVTDSLKLDRESEGHDDTAFVRVHVGAIPPWTNSAAFFDGPDNQQMAEIEAVLRTIPTGGTWLVHCIHGQDRTGLAVGMYRVLTGWTVAKAKTEMDARGFHDSLVGLRAAWKQWSEGRP